MSTAAGDSGSHNTKKGFEIVKMFKRVQANKGKVLTTPATPEMLKDYKKKSKHSKPPSSPLPALKKKEKLSKECQRFRLM